MRIASLNSSRSSAFLMESILAPISSTPYLSSTPASASATERFNPVCPPTVESSASGRSLRMISSAILDAERLDVGPVGQVRIGHDGGRIRIDQHHFIAVRAQRFAGLRAGIIELAGLADDDRPGADDQNAMEIVAPRHLCVPGHQFHKIVEQIVRIVRPGRGLGMILHAEHRMVR